MICSGLPLANHKNLKFFVVATRNKDFSGRFEVIKSVQNDRRFVGVVPCVYPYDKL